MASPHAPTSHVVANNLALVVRPLVAAGLLALALAAPTLSWASSLNASSLKALCTSQDDGERALCRGYLQGFLDGASTSVDGDQIAADEGVPTSSWMRRAFETRVGTHVERPSLSATASSEEACLAQEEDAVQTLKARLRAERPVADEGDAGRWIAEFVRRNFPCASWS